MSKLDDKAAKDEAHIYKCAECNFQTDDAATAEEHNIETDHCID